VIKCGCSTVALCGVVTWCTRDLGDDVAAGADDGVDDDDVFLGGRVLAPPHMRADERATLGLVL